MAEKTPPEGTAARPTSAYVDGQRVAAVAPDVDQDSTPELTGQDRSLDLLCEQWVSWCRTRRLYGPAPITGTLLGRMTGGSSRPVRAEGIDAISSAELAAFHIAYTCQPDALDKRVFDLYYVHRIKPVKSAAAALGIGKSHFYNVLAEFRRRVHTASLKIAEHNERERASLGDKNAARDADSDD